MRRILCYLKPYTKDFALSQLLMIAATVSGLLFPLLIRNFFDNLITTEDYLKFVNLIGILLILYLVSHICNYNKEKKLGILGEKIIRDIRIDVFKKLQRLSVGFYTRQKSGDVVSRLTNDMNLFQMSLSTGLTYLLKQFIALVFIIYMLLRIDLVLTLIVFSMFPFILLVSRHMGKKARAISRKVQKKLGDITSFINESISGINVIKAFTLERDANRIYRRENERLFGDSIKNIKVKAKSNLLIGFLTSLQLLTLIALGGYRVFNGSISAGDLIAFLLYVEMVVGPLSMLSNLYMDVQKSMAAIGRIMEILSSDDEINDDEHSVEMYNASGAIEFKSVCFSYRQNEYVLKNVSMSIRQGEKVALVGSSGAGKSTIINLIPRFYELCSGEILVDGINTRDIKIKSLRSNIAIVPQDTNLFGMSIVDNILCGNPDAGFEQVVEASKKANAHEFIMSFPDGYETIVGERGSTLSGGQKQRIAIARAFLKDPAILLLDEATSSLDAYSERKVIDALDKLMENRTTIMIAHRLSTVVDFDCIFIINEGGIADKGTHEELLESCEYYRNLYQGQYGKSKIV